VRHDDITLRAGLDDALEHREVIEQPLRLDLG
jgi:hypothetical protein